MTSELRNEDSEHNDRENFVLQLEKLFAEADTRDRGKEGSAGPFSRTELYGDSHHHAE